MVTNRHSPEPIAIIGIGCRLAGDITTPADFWDFLLAGGSAVRAVPAERWEPYRRRDPRNAAVLRDTTPYGTFLDDLAGFDAELQHLGDSFIFRPLSRARPSRAHDP